MILQEANRCICFISDGVGSFYLNIPNSNKVHLMISLVNHVTDDVVKKYKDNPDVVIITPVIDENILTGVKQNNMKCFTYLDGLFSKIINLSHRILTYNHLNIENLIYFNQNLEFSAFNTWYIQKYNGRVVLSQISFIGEHFDANNLSSNDLSKEVLADKVNDVADSDFKSVGDSKKSDVISKHADKKDLGFVSYVLLGVVVAVASLILLY